MLLGAGYGFIYNWSSVSVQVYTDASIGGEEDEYNC